MYCTRRGNEAGIRPTRCLFCSGDVRNHFSRHLMRTHGEQPSVKQYWEEPNTKLRAALIDAIRRKGNLQFLREENVVRPEQRASAVGGVVKEYNACKFCNGRMYAKESLRRHVKIAPRLFFRHSLYPNTRRHRYYLTHSNDNPALT